MTLDDAILQGQPHFPHHSLLPERFGLSKRSPTHPIDVRQWHERYRTDRDHRRSDHWPLVLLPLITAWCNAPTLSPSTRSPAQTKVPQTRAINL